MRVHADDHAGESYAAGWIAAGGHGAMQLGPWNASDAAVAAATNAAWLEDCIAHLLCVLTLDRFGDFGSDQVSPFLLDAGGGMHRMLYEHEQRCCCCCMQSWRHVLGELFISRIWPWTMSLHLFLDLGSDLAR